MVLTRQACSASCEESGLRECGVLTRASASGVASVTGSSQQPPVKRNLIELPPEVLMKILSNLPMKKVAETRLVCRRFNAISGETLTSTFQRLQQHVMERFNSIKQQMPRRESARRHHARAREADVMETLSMRLSLLQMSFGRHIQKGHVCFFPGEILDEVQRILNCINSAPEMVKAYNVTEELCDLSAMAMEYFKEKLEPTLPEISYLSADLTFWDPVSNNEQLSDSASTSAAAFSEDLSHPGLASMPLPMGPPPPISWRDETESISSDMTSTSTASNTPASDMVVKKSFRRIRLGMQKYNSELIRLRKDLKVCKTRVASQNKLLSKYHSRLDEYDKKFKENTEKFSTLIQELNKCKTELQYWRAKGPLAMEHAGMRPCEKCGHMKQPVDGAEDRRALVHQGMIMDPSGSIGINLEDGFAGPSGLNGVTAGPLDFPMCYGHESSESEAEPDANTDALVQQSAPTSKKGGKKLPAQQPQVQQPVAQPQQHPMVGKRKRKAGVDQLSLPGGPAAGNQSPQAAAAACYAPPPLSPKNLRCKAAKLQAASAGGAVGKTAGAKRLKLS